MISTNFNHVVPSRNDAAEIQRKGGKKQRRNAGKANSETNADGTGDHQMVMFKN